MGWDAVADYKPKAEQDDFGAFKANGLECSVVWARVEPYSGPKAELQGVPFFGYELEIIGGTTDFLGRKLWMRFNLEDEKKLQKLKNLFFTVLSVDLKSQQDLEANLDAFASQTYVVRAWGWKPDENSETIQQHAIKGVKKETASGAEGRVAF